MKKFLTLIISIFILYATLSLSAIAASSSINVYIDNFLTQLTDANGNEVYPFIQDGTTYVPLRGVSEALDCDVIWDGNNNTILIYKEMQSDNSVFRNKSDEIKLYVDNQLTELKDANGTTVKPFIKDGTTYVPLRGVSQALGCWVRWNGQTQTVSVYMKEVPPDGVTLSENKPYEKSNSANYIVSTYYELDGNRLEIDKTHYTNALSFTYSETYALFNLDGKFDYMSMTIGSYGYFDEEKTMTFIVDGKIVDTHTISVNSGAEKINVNLNKGLQLKIVLTDGDYVGLGNIIFWEK